MSEDYSKIGNDLTAYEKLLIEKKQADEKIAELENRLEKLNKEEKSPLEDLMERRTVCLRMAIDLRVSSTWLGNQEERSEDATIRAAQAFECFILGKESEIKND